MKEIAQEKGVTRQLVWQWMNRVTESFAFFFLEEVSVTSESISRSYNYLR